MLQLDRKGLLDKAAWEAVGIELPKYDLELVAHNTRVRPQWVHFGAGNIFRGFVANAQQQLLNSLKADTGIIAAETFDFGMIDKAYKPYDNLTLLVLMSADGKFHKSVVASIVESLATEQNRPDDYLRLLEVFENPTLQMASFTVTEKGYGLTGPDGKYLAVVERDLVNGPEQPVHVMSIATSLAYRRYLKGQHPMTLVSMDNCSHNGDLLKDSMIAIAKEWTRRGLVEKGFADYLQNEEKITFPLTMIDKITPALPYRYNLLFESWG